MRNKESVLLVYGIQNGRRQTAEVEFLPFGGKTNVMLNLSSILLESRTAQDDAAQHGGHTPGKGRPRHAALVSSLTLDIHGMADLIKCR